MNFSELLITHLWWRKNKNRKVIWCGRNTGKYTNVLRPLGMFLCVLSGVYCLLNTTVILNSCQYRRKCSLTSLSVYGSIKKKTLNLLMEKNITFYKTLVYNHCHHYWPFMWRYFNIWVTMCLVAQSCPTLCDSMDCSPLGTSVHGILQGRTLEWVAMPFSKGSSQPRDQTWVSHISGRFCTTEPP